jgi:hypothetical protein
MSSYTATEKMEAGYPNAPPQVAVAVIGLTPVGAASTLVVAPSDPPMHQQQNMDYFMDDGYSGATPAVAAASADEVSPGGSAVVTSSNIPMHQQEKLGAKCCESIRFVFWVWMVGWSVLMSLIRLNF